MPDLYYDLHIHSCLSPCGDDDMTPANIVGMAKVKGLDLIALADHNSCKNCPATAVHAQNYGITFLPAMELTTAEEVHVLCLFAKLEDAMAWDAYVSKHLMPFPNKEDIFGKQQVMNSEDEVIGTEPYLLINATDISFDDVYEMLKPYHGIMIPAHIAKSTTSLLSCLGFIPPDSRFRCAELSDLTVLPELKKKHPYLEDCRIICNSDAHYLQDISEPIHRLHVPDMDPETILKVLEQWAPHPQ